MFNRLALAAAILPLLGWRQPLPGTPDTVPLEEDLVASPEQRVYQDFHPLITLPNILLAGPQLPNAAPVPGPDASGFLRIGPAAATVLDNNVVSPTVPLTTVTQQLSQYLREVSARAADKVLTSFAERKKLQGAGKTILEDVQLTSSQGAYQFKIIKQGRFCGLAIRPGSQRDLVVKITKLGTQFTEPAPDFKLYLYHASQPAPLAVIPVPLEKSVYVEWNPIKLALSAGLGGNFLLGYYEADLPGQAIRLEHDFARRPCQTCNNDYVLFDKWSRYVGVRAFSYQTYIDEEGKRSLVGAINYQSDTNWGLNLGLSVQCDLADYLGRYAESFTNALGLQVAVELLEMMAFSTRENGLSERVKAMALMELNNKDNFQKGLYSKLNDALAALDVDLSGISTTCLPCAPTKGVRTKSI